jgi:hypothetical protein
MFVDESKEKEKRDYQSKSKILKFQFESVSKERTAIQKVQRVWTPYHSTKV